MGYLIAGIAGFLLGTVITCILLATKNFEKYKRIESQFSDNIQNQFDNAKAMYNGMVAAYENGDDEDEEDDEMSEAEDEE